MELEFDKEIDAILRKAQPIRGVLVGDDPAKPKKHLDADTIAAFAENALPQQAKLLYMEHFADCDRCRKQLSHAIWMKTEADAAAASSVSAPVAEAAIPWYQNLFKTQNLALAMGALVLTFSGVLGYLVLQNSNNADTATVSQVAEQEPARSGPYDGGESGNVMSNSTNVAAPANSVATAANTNANTAMQAKPLESAPGGVIGRTDMTGGDTLASGSSTVADADKRENKSLAAAPPPPVTLDGIMSERDEKKADDTKLNELPKDLEMAKRKQMEDRGGGRSRDLPPAAAKSGPARSGPVQNQSNQMNSQVFDMAVARLVGGKRFENRNGAWYDSAYRGQATTNVRRGTDEFKKLDGGLRNIANMLGGTVVVVWNGKAYRIQ